MQLRHTTTVKQLNAYLMLSGIEVCAHKPEIRRPCSANRRTFGGWCYLVSGASDVGLRRPITATVAASTKGMMLVDWYHRR